MLFFSNLTKISQFLKFFKFWNFVQVHICTWSLIFIYTVVKDLDIVFGILCLIIIDQKLSRLKGNKKKIVFSYHIIVGHKLLYLIFFQYFIIFSEILTEI